MDTAKEVYFNHMAALRSACAEALAEAAAKAGFADVPKSAELAASLEYPPGPAMGDLALPCFKLSKVLRRAPPEIAAALAEHFQSDALTAAPAGGFLNFKIADDQLIEAVADINRAGFGYGASDAYSGKTAVLDYSAPNICKPFHRGHLRSTVIGNSINLILKFVGYKTVSIDYLGDWGVQFGKMIVAYKRWGDTVDIERDGVNALVKIYTRFHEEAKENPALDDEARSCFKALESGDPEAVELWSRFRRISIDELMRSYARMGIEFDSYNGEAFYNDKMQPVVDELKADGLLKLDQGAMVVDLSEWNMPPCLILKRDGATLYPTRDIASALYRKREYNFDRAIYLTEAKQSLHFRQWMKVVELMGYEWVRNISHITFGTVTVDGQPLSTREGNMVLLEDIFNEAVGKVAAVIEQKNPGLPNKAEVAEKVGIGAIVFSDLKNNRERDVDFNWDDALNFDGNTGPYVQYTYARACSVLSRAGGRGAACAAQFGDALERELAAALIRFPDAVLDAYDKLEPSVISRCLLDLCAVFNRFYHDCPILRAATPELVELRLRLTEAARYTLGAGMRLIGLALLESI